MIIKLSDYWKVEDVSKALEDGFILEYDDFSKSKVEECNQFLYNKLESSTKPIYGINTGFGSLHHVKIEKDDLSKLQENLLLSHACGTGDTIPEDIVKLIILLKCKSLAKGHSGLQSIIVERLTEFYNKNITPVIYELGSLGASGDLAPLAHMALPLINHGQVWEDGQIVKAKPVLEANNIKPITLGAKDGLALINGTQFMSAYGVYGISETQKLLSWANKIASLSADSFSCKPEPYNSLTHKIRPHLGQNQVASVIYNHLSNSPFATKDKDQVQDPYSFRCVPQVHGAINNVLSHILQTVEVEINAVTDNPNIFPQEDLVLSGGNFHGQILAFALDYLSMALAEIASISERRIYKLISGERGLPAFLVANPGLNSGFMIVQYAAASAVSANKQYCTPASVDSIVSSNGQEDHVSMGANAATQMYKVLENVKSVLAMELLSACQAWNFRKKEGEITSPDLLKLHQQFREEVPFIENDVEMHLYIEKAKQFIDTHNA